MFDHFRRSDGSKPPLLCLFLFFTSLTSLISLIIELTPPQRSGTRIDFCIHVRLSLCVCVCERERQHVCVQTDVCESAYLSVCVGDVCVGSVVFYSVMVSRSTAQLVFSVGVAAEQRPPPGLAEWPSVCSACRLIHHCGNTDRTKGHAGMRKIRVCSLSSGCINVHACLRDPCTRRLCIAGV